MKFTVYDWMLKMLKRITTLTKSDVILYAYLFDKYSDKNKPVTLFCELEYELLGFWDVYKLFESIDYLEENGFIDIIESYKTQKGVRVYSLKVNIDRVKKFQR